MNGIYLFIIGIQLMSTGFLIIFISVLLQRKTSVHQPNVDNTSKPPKQTTKKNDEPFFDELKNIFGTPKYKLGKSVLPKQNLNDLNKGQQVDIYWQNATNEQKID